MLDWLEWSAWGLDRPPYGITSVAEHLDRRECPVTAPSRAVRRPRQINRTRSFALRSTSRVDRKVCRENANAPVGHPPAGRLKPSEDAFTVFLAMLAIAARLSH